MPAYLQKRSVLRSFTRLLLLVGSANSASLLADFSAKKLPPVVQVTVQQYGWAIPICVWSNKTAIHPTKKPTRPLYCVTVAELLKKFPYHRTLITTQTAEAVMIAYSAQATLPRTPEALMQQVATKGNVIGCVLKGPNQGFLTLGSTNPQNLMGASITCKRTKSDGNAFSDALVFGALVGSTPKTPPGSLSATGQATYEHYYQQCKERQRADTERQSLMSGSSATPEELEAEAMQAAEEAVNKQKEADAARKAADDAQKAKDDAAKKAQDVYNDPDASATDMLKAGNESLAADTAWQLAKDSAMQAQVGADASEQAADAARTALHEAERDADLRQATGDATKEFLDGVKDGIPFSAALLPLGQYGVAVEAGFLLGLTINWAGGVTGAYAGRYGYSCVDESACGHQSCHFQARSKALDDEVTKYRSNFTCNTTTTPVPDDDRCYDKPGGIFDLPQTTVLELQRFSCELVQKVSDRTCEDALPREIVQVTRPDLCSSPYAMCDPESSGGPSQSGGTGDSKPIPRPFRGEDPTMWGK